MPLEKKNLDPMAETVGMSAAVTEARAVRKASVSWVNIVASGLFLYVMTR